MPRKITIAENDLVALLKSKDQRGYSVLYNNYSAALYGVLNNIIKSEEDASDLLQDSFIKIWKNIDYYDSSKGTLFTWMLNLTRNLAIDKVRSATYKESTQNVELIENIKQVDYEYFSEANIDGIGLQKVVEKLRPEYKNLIDLIYYKGYTQLEVSEEFGIPLGTVKTRIKAAIAQLRHMISIILVFVIKLLY